jgi:hypothetical protein
MKDFMSDIFDDLASDIYRCLISQKTHDPDNDMAVNVADALIQLNETIENSTSQTSLI